MVSQAGVFLAVVPIIAVEGRTFMGILLWIIFGALAGWIASLVMRTRQGLLLDIVVGIIGAVIGGFIFRAFGAAGVSGFNFYSLLVAILGAIVLLWIVKAVRRA
jgi:uncharacterized membrane protein YeaQ/YmgE (transglycosylase-associated protein family)